MNHPNVVGDSAIARPKNPRMVRRRGLRPLFTLAHRYAGLFIAFFLIIAGATGTAIAFYRELDSALNPELYRIEERAQPPLGVEALAAAIRGSYPHAFVNLLMLDRRAGESVRVRLTPLVDPATGKSFALDHSEIFVDPFDGRVLGGRDRGNFRADRAHLMPFLYKLHYTLYLPAKWGDWFMGIVALVWLFDGFVGFYLTLPVATGSAAKAGKNWWRRWRTAWQIKRGASRARLNFDLHRAGGLWLWLVFIMLAFTGVYFNLTNELFRPVLGWITPLTPEVAPMLKTLPQSTLPATLTFDEAIVRAEAVRSDSAKDMVPSFVGLMPDSPGIYRVRFADSDRGDASWHFHYENLYIDGRSGELITRISYYGGTVGDKIVLWQYPLHSGFVFGFWGRVVIGASGLVVVLLSITGIVIWLRKRRRLAIRATEGDSRN